MGWFGNEILIRGWRCGVRFFLGGVMVLFIFFRAGARFLFSAMRIRRILRMVSEEFRSLATIYMFLCRFFLPMEFRKSRGACLIRN